MILLKILLSVGVRWVPRADPIRPHQIRNQKGRRVGAENHHNKIKQKKIFIPLSLIFTFL